MWNLLLVHLEILYVSVQDRCMVCTKHLIGLKNHFGHTRWYSSVTRLRWKLDSFRLEIVGIVMQDRCIVCAKRTTGSEIIFHPMELLGDVGHVEYHFDPSGDSVSVGAR
jgi:hypothetical protein